MRYFLQKISLLPLFLMFLSPASWALEGDQYLVSVVVGEPEFVVLREEDDRFEVVQRGLIQEGNRLPQLYCTICLPEDSYLILVDPATGKEIELSGPDVYDLWLLKTRTYRKERIRVTEGTVVVQSTITVDGKTMPVGPPIVLQKGNSIETDPCFKTVKTEVPEDLGVEAQVTLSNPGEDPIDEPPPDPSPAA